MLIVGIFVLLLAQRIMTEGPLVTVEQGVLQGIELESHLDKSKYYAFFEIPFAEPPVGDKRFKAPQPPLPWEGVREPQEEREGCIRYNPMFQFVEGNEDCLYLHVFTPKTPAELQDSLKPVMVWIHGGAFHIGSGGTKMYGPDFLLSQDVVVVNIHYRLGAFGFLSLQNHEIPGNAGLKDQVMALKWVQSNIKAFGGDPNKVTIFGESAGGASVHYLMLSPTAKGLFHRAIAQSGSALNGWSCTNSTRVAALQLAQVFDCNIEDDNAMLDCLNKLDTEDLASHQYNIMSPKVEDLRRGTVFFPCVEPKDADSPFLMERPEVVAQEGRFNDVPFMAGTTSMETMSLAKIFDNLGNMEKYKGVVVREINKRPSLLLPLNWEIHGSVKEDDVGRKLKEFYFHDLPISSETAENFVNVTTDTYFLLGTQDSVHCHSRKGQSPVFQYYFRLDTNYNRAKSLLSTSIKGTSHADDIGYLFYVGMSPQNVKNKESSGYKGMVNVVKLWTNFAKFGNPTPNNELGLNWEPYTGENKYYLEINEELSLKEFVERDRMLFWEKIRKEEHWDLKC